VNGGLRLGFAADSTKGPPPPFVNPLRYVGDRHVVIVGPNGSQKSMGICLPFLVENTGWSVAVCDPKGEFRKLTEQHRRNAGNLVITLDPFGKRSDGFNPIAALPLDDNLPDDALELAEAVVKSDSKDPHWPQAAQEFVAALILYVRLVIPGGSFDDVRELMSRDDNGIRMLVKGGHNVDPRQLELWEKTDPKERDPSLFPPGYFPPVKHRGRLLPGMIAASILHNCPEIERKAARFGGISSDDREMHSVLSTALVQTRWLDSRPIIRDLAKNPFDFSVMRDKPVTVYIVLPPRRLATHSSWIRLIMASIVQRLMTEARPGKVPVCLLCDEFAALAGGIAGGGGDGFPAVTNQMAVFRQYGIKLISIWQDLAQARGIFGDAFETFLANAGVFQVFAPRDIVTSEYVSKMTGQTTVEILSQGQTRAQAHQNPMGVSLSDNSNISLIAMPLMLPQDVRNLGKGYALIFTNEAEGTIRAFVPWPGDLAEFRNIMALADR
jgi:type IV secretion system protein VirD4